MKKDGKWLKNLKFVGLELYQLEGEYHLKDNRGRSYPTKKILENPRLLKTFFNEVYPQIETWD